MNEDEIYLDVLIAKLNQLRAQYGNIRVEYGDTSGFGSFNVSVQNWSSGPVIVIDGGAPDWLKGGEG